MTLDLHEVAWTAGARCVGQPSELFYTSRAAVSLEREQALACCNAGSGCPARRHCLAYAIANNERDGTWGGMLSRERGDLGRTRCRSCRTPLGRTTVADMIQGARQHTRCDTCGSWVEVIPPWDRPHRNSWITGTGRRT